MAIRCGLDAFQERGGRPALADLPAAPAFTITDARHSPARSRRPAYVLNSVYGAPTLGSIDNYVRGSGAQLLKARYLEHQVDYGFKSNDGWSLRLRYIATIGGQVRDDAPGRLPYDAPVNGLPFYSYLRCNSAFQALGSAEQRAFKATLPVERSEAEEPGLGGGSYGTSASYARNSRRRPRSVVFHHLTPPPHRKPERTRTPSARNTDEQSRRTSSSPSSNFRGRPRRAVPPTRRAETDRDPGCGRKPPCWPTRRP